MANTSNTEYLELWVREAVKRYEEIKKGKTQPIPANEVMRMARERHQRMG